MGVPESHMTGIESSASSRQSASVPTPGPHSAPPQPMSSRQRGRSSVTQTRRISRQYSPAASAGTANEASGAPRSASKGDGGEPGPPGGDAQSSGGDPSVGAAA